MLTADDLAYACVGQLDANAARSWSITTGSDGMGGEIDIYAYSDDHTLRVAPMRVQAAESVQRRAIAKAI